MAKFIGRLVDLGIAKEATRGTFVAPTFWVPKTSFSFDDKVVKARSLGSLGEIGDSEESFVTTQYGEGDLEGEIRDKSFGLFLLAMMGSVSTSGPSDSAYTHSFTISHSNQHPSLSFVVQDEITQEAYKLAMLNQLEIMAELDEVVRYTASFMSKKGNDYSSVTPAYTADNKFTKKHVKVKVASSLGGLAAASVLSIKSLRFTINKNVTLDDALGTAEPEDILNQMMSVEGELTLNYEDQTWKNYMRDNTSRAMEIVLENTDTLIGATSRPKITVQMPKVDFFDWEPNYALDEIVTQTISFKASRDLSGGNQMISTCQLINATSSY